MGGANPRVSNGHRRRELRRKVAALGLPCAICGKPIDYSLDTWTDPKDGRVKPHPWRYELDEICPVSRWSEGGYSSPTECALDPSNVQPTHRICNQRKGSRTGGAKRKGRRRPIVSSGEW